MRKHRRAAFPFLAASLAKYVQELASQRIFFEKAMKEDYASLPHLYVFALLKTFATTNYLAGGDLQRLASKVLRSPELKDGGVNRRLELKCLLEIGGIPHRLGSYAGLVKATDIGARRHLCPVTSTNMEVYRLTHVAFHCSRFGTYPILGLSLSEKKFLSRQIEVMLPIFLYSRDLDISGELLLADHCLGHRMWAERPGATDLILSSQMSSGAIPGPYYSSTEEGDLRGEGAEDYLFSTCYHSTLVLCLLLCSVCANAAA